MMEKYIVVVVVCFYDTKKEKLVDCQIFSPGIYFEVGIMLVIGYHHILRKAWLGMGFVILVSILISILLLFQLMMDVIL